MSDEKAHAQQAALAFCKAGGRYAFRSCWNCNSAHDHLKEHDLILCFACGHWYWRGIDITSNPDDE